MTNCHIIYLIHKKRGKDMKQSRRIELCKQYHKHRLKNEYERKKSTICKKSMPTIIKFFRYMIVGYLILFIGSIAFGLILEHNAFFIILTYVIPVLGIINLVVVCFTFNYEKGMSNKEIENLKQEYEEKGLIEMPESELWKHECCEYDDYREITVCCVTKQPLSYKDYSFCKTPGNCKYCRTFVSGYLGSDAVEWWGKSHEYKR